MGSNNVFVNGRPALRMTDRGVHTPCCGPNTWMAQGGSATVFINGKPAHRMGDMTLHCGGLGRLAEGSSDVIVGDSTAAGMPLPSLGALSLPKVAMPGVPFTLRLGPVTLPRFVSNMVAAVIWTVDGVVLPMRGDGISIRFGPQHVGRDIAIRADLGLGMTLAETKVAVPRLVLDGGDTVEIDEELQLHARVLPSVEGKYRWYDVDGKQFAEGPDVVFVGKKKSKQKGDQPVECRFTARDGSVTLAETHKITVTKIPRLKLPIKVSLRTMAETVRWLRDNAMEVRIDGAVAGCHAMAESAGRIIVSFAAPEGEHAVMISSGASNWAAGRSPTRLVHFSAKVTVTPSSD